MTIAADARASERSADALIEAWYAAWNAHDVAAAQDLVAADGVLEEPDAPEGGHRGPEAVGTWMSTWFRACPDMHLDEHQRWVSADGLTVATWFTVRATLSGPLDPPGFAPTNTAIEVAGMDRTEIRDGLVARHQIFYDSTTVARQIGAAPCPARSASGSPFASSGGRRGDSVAVGVTDPRLRRPRSLGCLFDTPCSVASRGG